MLIEKTTLRSARPTPMEAVKDADEREGVELLVIQGERFGHNWAMANDEDVFRRLRERLGLARSQSFLYKQLSNRVCIGDDVHT